MRYCSFATGDSLILESLPKDENLSFLEIGVGLGGVAEKMIGRVKEYWGVDIACESVAHLARLYENVASLHFDCLDVCKESSSLNKKFDVVFSYHVLEHVSSPQGYFDFIGRHLKPDGSALVIFPNETEERHHGITWFEDKKDLVEMISRAGLETVRLLEVKETTWHRAVKKFFWKIPRSIILGKEKKPQTFEETNAFKIVKSHNIKTDILAFYARLATGLAAILPLYKYRKVDKNIQNKTLFIRLKHR